MKWRSGIRHNMPEIEDVAARTRRSFLALGAGAVAAGGAFQWVVTRHEEDGLVEPLRGVLKLNEGISRNAYGTAQLAPEFMPSQVQPLRANGNIGLADDVDPAEWQLTLRQVAGQPERTVTLADIRALPRVEHRTEFKCIEGWSRVFHFAGARFSDFTGKFAPASAQAEYIGMETPNGEYYVGLDRASAMHPQTLLCYEMNGAALTAAHGAPLRLAIPVKYGIKNIKRIGKISYSTDRPADYWAEEGYDWYAGL